MSGSEVYGVLVGDTPGHLPRAWCPWCGNDAPIRKNGAFRQHESWRDATTHERCPASGLTRQEAQAMEDEWKAKLAREDAGHVS